MNYEKHYESLILKAKSRILDKEIYCERHHIIPKSEGGLDTKENIIKLTAREHFLAHWLLHRMDPDNSSRAHSFWRMCRGRGKVAHKNWIVISSRAYEEARVAHSKAISKKLKGRKKSSEHILKVADSNKGKKRTEIAKLKMSEAAKKRGIASGFYEMLKLRELQNKKQEIQVSMLEPTTKTILKTFNSLKEAASFVNRDISNISAAIKKGSKCGNYYWCKHENRQTEGI